MPAEPKLVKYAYRVSQDIPEGLAEVKFVNMDEKFETEINPKSSPTQLNENNYQFENMQNESNYDSGLQIETGIDQPSTKGLKNSERIMGILGQYQKEMLYIEGCENLVISEKFLEKLNYYR
jgi:hypothetical protein